MGQEWPHTSISRLLLAQGFGPPSRGNTSSLFVESQRAEGSLKARIRRSARVSLSGRTVDPPPTVSTGPYAIQRGREANGSLVSGGTTFRTTVPTGHSAELSPHHSFGRRGNLGPSIAASAACEFKWRVGR